MTAANDDPCWQHVLVNRSIPWQSPASCNHMLWKIKWNTKYLTSQNHLGWVPPTMIHVLVNRSISSLAIRPVPPVIQLSAIISLCAIVSAIGVQWCKGAGQCNRCDIFTPACPLVFPPQGGPRPPSVRECTHQYFPHTQ